MRLIISIFFVFFALSCSKEADEPSLKWGQRIRIKKMVGTYGNMKTFIYNQKGLLTKIINTSDESYEITYNASDLPVKIVPFDEGRDPSYYYLITWGKNQFTFTLMPQENFDYYSATVYTLNENRIDKMIARTRANDGKESTSMQQCTWFGNDSLYVDITFSDNSKIRDEYKFIDVPGIFKHINLAVCFITRLTFFYLPYQNNMVELASNGAELDYLVLNDGVPYLISGGYGVEFLCEYEYY